LRTIIHSDPMAVARRLRELNLSIDVLRNSVTAAYQAWSNCTDLDPKMYPGLTMYAVAVRHLRMHLLPQKWTVNDDGISLTVSPDGSMAISVATGDEATGIAKMSPTTQSSKGPRTIEAVAANNAQLGFELTFPDGWDPPMIDPARLGDFATWVLLIHRDQESVRAELSHPLGIDEYGCLSGWRERILLPSMAVDPLHDVETDDLQRTIDVPVQRKA
jgi:hypothetical protein